MHQDELTRLPVRASADLKIVIGVMNGTIPPRTSGLTLLRGTHLGPSATLRSGNLGACVG
jgi:hypothetical protein